MRARYPGCDILVTGFGRYPGVRHNPAAMLATRVSDQLGRAGHASHVVILPVTYDGGLALLREQIHRHKPRAILMLGLAARSRWFRVEMFACMNPSPLHADASGRVPLTGSGAALPMRSSAEPGIALAILRASGARVRLSPSAGRYLCNASYAQALELGGSSPVLFIHIPPAMQWRIDGAELARALARIGRQMIVKSRFR